MSYKLDFDTQYNQFYICDKNSPKNTGTRSFWTAKAYNDRLAIGDGILGVGIQSYGHVKGVLKILEKKDVRTPYDKYDHIVQGGLKITSGVLQVLDCPNSAIELQINIKPGIYCVRIYSAGIATTDIDKYEGNDHYLIEIWPEAGIERKVLK